MPTSRSNSPTSATPLASSSRRSSTRVRRKVRRSSMGPRETSLRRLAVCSVWRSSWTASRCRMPFTRSSTSMRSWRKSSQPSVNGAITASGRDRKRPASSASVRTPTRCSLAWNRSCAAADRPERAGRRALRQGRVGAARGTHAPELSGCDGAMPGGRDRTAHRAITGRRIACPGSAPRPSTPSRITAVPFTIT